MSMMRPIASQRPATVRSAAFLVCSELGEGVLDRVEVGTIGRKIQERSAGRLDQLAYAWPFVAGEIVHDDDGAIWKLRDQHLFDIGLEGIAVDGAIEHPGRDDAARGEGGNAGCCFPVAMRNAGPQAFSAQASTMCSRHVGRCPGLVDEDEPIPVEFALALAPGLASRQDIRAILLCGMGGLFLRVILWRSKKRRIVP